MTAPHVSVPSNIKNLLQTVHVDGFQRLPVISEKSPDLFSSLAQVSCIVALNNVLWLVIRLTGFTLCTWDTVEKFNVNSNK